MYLLLTFIILRAALAVAATCDSITISSEDDANTIQGCRTVTGDVVLSTDITDAISLEGVEEIAGNLKASGSPITSLSAPKLRSIGRDLALHGLAEATDISFPQLNEIGGVFDLDSLPSLTALNISVLTSVESFHLGSMANLTKMELQHLYNVTGANPTVNISSVGLESVSGFNETSRLKSFTLQNAPNLKLLPIRTAEIDTLFINGSGVLTVDFFVGNMGPKFIGALNITGCANFFPFPDATTVNALNLYQNTFSDLELELLEVKDSIRIMDNPNLDHVLFPNSDLVRSVIYGPPTGSKAPQWKELVITGNPKLDSDQLDFADTDWGFWYWGARNLSTLIMTGSSLHNKFFDPDDTTGQRLPETNHTYTTAEFRVSTDAIGFNCSFLDSLRSKGLFQGSYSCQGNTIPAGPVPGTAMSRVMSVGILLGSTFIAASFVAI
ncbi:uncharacterized protein JN550_002391 [Neoarthrinium moseri]|uniref:uncharacterized protein n=1 Tax=Neoarthrinium moseri TaxID=1658444 RepID=UPI001FDCDE82|nr:uncharacterized protein JN550_002391 [Neoarthrinium moseri]KAI1874962.1 hypothetical protein JN550_002391 [Neoarthrinium moseri]